MQIEMMPPARLVPYARNARTHSDAQVAQIAASIREFGFTNSILIGGDDIIIAGHGRLIAAQLLGLTEVPVIVLDHERQAVYEPFMGSGTTLIAAESCGRICLGLELNPAYVDVAVDRWQQFTGEAALLDGDGRSFDEVKAERGGT